MANEAAKDRAKILGVIAAFITMFVLINAREFILSAIIYLVIFVVSLQLYNQWDTFGKKGNLAGIDENWIQDAFIGLLIGGGIIGLGQIIPAIATLGIPNVQSVASEVGRFLIIVVSAPIFEELLFRDFMLDFVNKKLGNVPFFFAALITSAMFSVFHAVAYGDSLSAVSASFITAAVMGMVFSYMRLYQDSVIGPIVTHMVLNAFTAFISLAVIVA